MAKYFTLEEANRALTLIRPITEDILTKTKKAQKLHNEVKIEKSTPYSNESMLLGKLQCAEKLLNEVEYHIAELNNIGVLLKDFDGGVVDFAHYIDGRIVYLCWMLGEETIQYWHEINEGFDKRKKIENAAVIETSRK